MSNPNPTLRKAHKVLRKITKKIGNPDLYYSAQLGIDSRKDSTVQTWAAMIEPPRDGLAPITFAAFSKEEFMQHLDDFLKNKVNTDQLEVVFHEAQIEANNRSIEYHQEQIDLIQNPKKDEDPTPSPEEAVTAAAEVEAEAETKATTDSTLSKS